MSQKYNIARLTYRKQNDSQLKQHNQLDLIFARTAMVIDLLLPASQDKLELFRRIEEVSREAHKCVNNQNVPMWLGTTPDDLTDLDDPWED